MRMTDNARGDRGARRVFRDAGWVFVGPFLLLIAVLSYVPWAGHRASVEAVIDRELVRHRILVHQVSLRLQAQGEHLLMCLRRLAAVLGPADFDEPAARAEIDAIWGMTSRYEDVDAFLVLDAEGREVASFATPAHAGREDRDALRRILVPDPGDTRPIRTSIQPLGSHGLHLVLAVRITGRGGEDRGGIAASVALDRLVDRLFRDGLFDGSVTFTITAQDGQVLLHSGFSHDRDPVTMEGTACDSCHGDARILERITQATPGGGRFVISGVDRVVAYAPVRIADQVWSISASTPSADVVLPVARQGVVSAAFTVGIVGLLLVLGLLLRRVHIRRIRLEEELSAKERLLALAREKERLDAELEASRRMAALGEMVARVAHEVKNPLQYIGTAVDLLSSTARGAVPAELVGDMRTGVRTLNAIVTELLDFSRPMRLERTDVDVNEVVSEVAGRVVPGDVACRLALEPDLPVVGADGYKLRQVLENLLRNAVDALPPPGGERAIVLSTRRAVEGRCAGGVEVEVADSGHGIPPEDLPRIWEPFVTTRTHGTGLGLPIVRRIVEAHGGDVAVVSEPGRGTRFVFRLPPRPE